MHASSLRRLTLPLPALAAGALLLAGVPRPAAAIAPVVHIDRPVGGQSLPGTTVRFDGLAAGGDVRLEVFDVRAGMRRVYNSTIRPVRNRWSASVRLARGDFRAEATLVRPGKRIRDGVHFTMRGGEGGGNNENRLRVLTPRNGATLMDRNVLLSGTSGGSDVKIQIYDQRGKRVTYQTLAVRGGRWSTTVQLPVGMTYRAVVELFNGRDRDEVRFTVAVPPKQPR
jgi:hypothetical protein